MKILLSGPPKVGKTTLLKCVLSHLDKTSMMGCVVNQLCRPEGPNEIRYGFEIASLPNGFHTLIASAEKKLSDHAIGRFSVDVAALEAYMIPLMGEMAASTTVDCLVFDEIGRMQHLCPHFIPALDQLLTTQKPLIATLVQDALDTAWAQIYRENPCYFVIPVTPDNRDPLTKILPLMVQGAGDYQQLSQPLQKEVVALFHTFLTAGRFNEMSKLFTHTVSYLAHHKARYNRDTKGYDVTTSGERTRNVSYHSTTGWSCVCDFHNNPVLDHKPICSHIQTVMLMENINPLINLCAIQ